MIAIQLDTTFAKRNKQAIALGALTIEQGDLLGVFAHTHQIEAKVGLISLLLEIQRDQGAADEMRESGSEHCVDQCRPQQVSGDIESFLRTHAVARPPTTSTG